MRLYQLRAIINDSGDHQYEYRSMWVDMWYKVCKEADRLGAYGAEQKIKHMEIICQDFDDGVQFTGGKSK